MAPRRSLRQHVAMRDDNSTISSGLSSGAGLVYVMPKNYRNKSRKPSPVEKAEAKQLSKLPLPPPRPKRSRSSRTMSDNSTVASGTSYTSRVSKVSIKSREPVLDSDDPLSKAMQDKIVDSKGKKTKRDALPTVVETSAELHSEECSSPQTKPSTSKKGFAHLPSVASIDAVERGVPTQVVASLGDPVILPPPPPLDTIETYSLATNDFHKYGTESPSFCSKHWRLLVCVACIIMFLVIAGAVAAVLMVLKNSNEDGTTSDSDKRPPPPSMSPAMKPPPTPTLAIPEPTIQSPPTEAALPTGAFAPIFAPIPAPVGTDIPTLPLERLVDLFSNLDTATALAMLDSASPQYRAMEWLEGDVQQNQFTLETATDRIFQRGTLAIFYFSTLGDTQWATSDGWLNSSSSECTWYGIDCAPDTTTLVSLVLEDNNLEGVLPGELGLLVSLEVLSLSENSMSSTIPDNLGQLTFLQNLKLDFNNLSGPIPLSLMETNELTYLALNGNGLTGALPTEIGFMTRLQEVYLYTNQFTSNLPSELGLLADCTFMVLAENKFDGKIPDTLGNAENLVGLSVSNNTLTGTVPASLGFLYDLQFLQLDGNELVGQVPLEICALDLGFDVPGAMTADCEGENPEIECACCSNCPPIWGGR